MSGSLSPVDEGSDPYDGQDLDGLLSGEDRCVPEGLRLVAPTLAALRAAPMRAELSGESMARAEFRKAMLAGRVEPAWPASGAGDARTLILPTGAADGGPRPHRHRRPPRRGRWQSKTLVGFAAGAVLIAGAAALAGTFSGSGGHHTALGSGAASATAQAGAPESNGLEGNGTPRPPSAKPTPQDSRPSGNSPGPSPRDLCREYFASFAPAGQHANWTAGSGLVQQLKSLAGGPYNIGGYCMHLLQPWSAAPKKPGYYPDMSNSGNHLPGGSQGFQGQQGQQGADQPPGNGGNGTGGGAGNGSDQGGNSPGSGGLNH